MTTSNKFLVGFGAGFILAVLYAPAKGTDTRSRLAKTGENIRDAWNGLTDRISKKIEDIREEVDELAELRG